MPYGPTSRLGLVAPLGAEQINQGDDSLRALVDRLDAILAPVSSGLLTNRPPSSAGTPGIVDRRYTATDAHATFRDTGTGWEILDQTPQVVSSLPSGTGIPFDGQEIYFLADAANGVLWRLRYRSASSSVYKWEAVGSPPPLLAEITAAEQQGTVAYADLTTVGPSVTLPLAGDYEVAIEAHAYGTLDAQALSMSYSIGATGAVDADRALMEVNGNTARTEFMRRRRRKNALTAVTLTMKYATVGGGTSTFHSRSIRATPFRVG